LSLLADYTTEPMSARQQIHYWVYIAGLVLLAIGMPTSTAFMTLGQSILGLNWILEGDPKVKWKRFTNNKAALVLCSFYIMHLLGLLYTTDFNYGLEEVKKKVPLLILPFLFCTSNTITDKAKRLVLFCFMGGVTYDTFLGCYILAKHNLVDIHNISPHVSPIRLGLMIVLSVFLLCGYVFSRKWKPISFVLLAWVAWLLIFLIIMESLTGVVIGASVSILLLIFYAVKRIKQKKVIRGIAILSVMLIGIIGATVYLNHFYEKYFPVPDKISYGNLDKKSASGNVYSYDSSRFVENGHYVNVYIALPELKNAWNKRSHIAFDSLDKKGNGIKYTLIRYLASMNLRKDSIGVSKLSPADIAAIENGIPNYYFISSKMDYRIYQVLWEIEDYKAGGDINGHSVTQRLEFWKAAVGIIKQHWLIGVGTGDVKKAFAAQYDAMHSKLKTEFRLRAHNQFLEIGVGFGIVGIIWLLFSLIYPAIEMKKFYSYAYVIFWLIFLFSTINEDTLESQAGVTFYAFFNSFFLFIF